MNVETGRQAIQIVKSVYDTLLQQVVIRKVIGEDRVKRLSKEAEKRIVKGTHIDGRAVRLMAISGKGGWHGDKAKRQTYAENRNITLLDHLLSVVRGSLTLAALDWLSKNPAMEEKQLKKLLTVMAAIAFLHDVDKDLYAELRQKNTALRSSRDLELGSQHVEILYTRYGIPAFLQTVEVTLSAEQMLYLVEKVEATQNYRHPPKIYPPQEFEQLTAWIGLADKLDGIYQKEGLNGVLARLAKDKGCLDEKSPLRTNWQAIDIFDPHHPFLLDELQHRLALACFRATGLLPLLETHQDGRLHVLLPKSGFETIVQQAIQHLCDHLPFNLTLNISKPGVPALYNGQPSYAELMAFIETLSLNSISELLRIQVQYTTKEMIQRLDDLLEAIGLQPQLPKLAGQLIRLYGRFDDLSEQAISWARQAALAVLMLNIKLETKAKDNIPKPQQREQILLNTLAQERPLWINDIEHYYTRSVISTLWAVSLAVENTTVEEAIWGDEGLLKHWLEEIGFNRFITGQGAQVVAGVKRHFQQLLTRQRIFPEDEANKQGRCLFTEAPVDFDDTIDEALGLYGVKVSAFSGRDHRPNSLTFDKSHTNVSPVSIAEHKLRTIAHAQQGGKENGVPSLISSPATLGLFGGLTLTTDHQIGAMSLYDLNRFEIKKGNVFHGIEIYQGRYRMARLERLAEKIEEQVNQLRMLLQGCRRLGRPIHVFRGLPTQQKAFFYYDAMPWLLTNLIHDLTDDDNSRALRLEQIPEALTRLEKAQILLETQGLGYDMLRLYATPISRFGAICLIACHFMDLLRNHSKSQKLKAWRGYFHDFRHEYLFYQGEQLVKETQEGALIRLGQAAAKIQKDINLSDSANEQLLIFNICLNTVNELRRAGQVDTQSIIYGVAGELQKKLSKRHNQSGKWLITGCQTVAELFVNEIWIGVLKKRAPSQGRRRILGSVYRMASLQAHREGGDAKKAEKADNQQGALVV